MKPELERDPIWRTVPCAKVLDDYDYHDDFDDLMIMMIPMIMMIFMIKILPMITMILMIMIIMVMLIFIVIIGTNMAVLLPFILDRVTNSDDDGHQTSSSLYHQCYCIINANRDYHLSIFRRSWFKKE